MTVYQARSAIQPLMPDADSAKIDCELLLAHAIGCNLTSLLAEPDRMLNSSAQSTLDQWAERRNKGEPIAYILASAGFMDITLQVNAHVLIPRPETEMLVNLLLDSPLPKKSQILDLGTGSGAIALAVAHARPDWHILATDISLNALAVAQANSVRLAIHNVDFICAGWCNGCADGAFDAIVANPPYIAQDDKHLHNLRFEPELALTAGHDGLLHINTIINTHCLRAGGWLLLEHGHTQQQQVQKALIEAGFIDIQTHHDLNGHPRVSLGHYAG